MTTLSRRFASLIVLLAAAPGVWGEDWPMFGGHPTRNSVSLEKNPPLRWQVQAPVQNIKWQTPLGTLTKGELVVAHGLVWVGTNNGQARDPMVKGPGGALMCFRESDGKFLYQYFTKVLDDSADLGFAGHTSSPMIEGDILWFTTIRGEVVCLDVGPLQRGQGPPREVWKVDMRKELGVYPSWAPMWGSKTCSIGAPYKDFIYVLTGNGVDENEKTPAPKAPTLISFNKRSGKVIWSDHSPGEKIFEGQFSSPLVIEIQGQAQVIAPMGDGWVRSFDALTGDLLWKFDTTPKDHKPKPNFRPCNNICATPVFSNQRIYIGTGSNPDYHFPPLAGWLFCLDPTKKGDISYEIVGEGGQAKPNPNSGMIWRFGGVDENKRRRFYGTLGNVAVSDGLVIAANMDGFVNCLDAHTGQQYWKHDTQANTFATPLIVDGKIYIGSDDGNLAILALGKDKKILGLIDVEDGLFTSPVFANGVLYLATRKTLYAIAGKEEPASKQQGHDWPQFGRDQTRNAVSPEKKPAHLVASRRTR